MNLYIYICIYKSLKYNNEFYIYISVVNIYISAQYTMHIKYSRLYFLKYMSRIFNYKCPIKYSISKNKT